MKIKVFLLVLVLLIAITSVGFASTSDRNIIPPPTGDVYYMEQGEIVQIWCSGHFITIETHTSTKSIVYCSVFPR